LCVLYITFHLQFLCIIDFLDLPCITLGFKFLVFFGLASCFSSLFFIVKASQFVHTLHHIRFVTVTCYYIFSKPSLFWGFCFVFFSLLRLWSFYQHDGSKLVVWKLYVQGECKVWWLTFGVTMVFFARYPLFKSMWWVIYF